MDPEIERLLRLADRVLLHIEHQIPPEVATTTELRTLVDKLMRARALEGARREVPGL